MAFERIIVIGRSLHASAKYCRYLVDISGDNNSRRMPIPAAATSRCDNFRGLSNIVVIFIDDAENSINAELRHFLFYKNATLIFH
jgi:hypothetical protein